MSRNMKHLQKPLNIDRRSFVTLKISTSPSFQSTTNSKSLFRSSVVVNKRQASEILARSPNSEASSTLIALTSFSATYSHSSFSHLSDYNQPKASSISSLPKIRITGSSKTDFSKISDSFHKPEQIPQTQKKFLPRTNLSTPEEIEDECKARYEAVYISVRELNEGPLFDKEIIDPHTLKEATCQVEKILKTANLVLGTMGINVRPCIYLNYDSGLTIHPITEKYVLANFYKMFIPEMCRFNYVFLLNLKIGTLTLCEAVTITDKKYSAILEQKIHNGMFILENMSNKKSIQKHWFRIVLYHFLKAVPGFYDDWKNLICSASQHKTKSPFKVLMKTFRRLVGIKQDNWREDLEVRTRVRVLREALNELNFTPLEGIEVGDD